MIRNHERGVRFTDKAVFLIIEVEVLIKTMNGRFWHSRVGHDKIFIDTQPAAHEKNRSFVFKLLESWVNFSSDWKGLRY